MKLKAPIITLLAGLVLAAGLYISDIRLSHEVASKKAAADIASVVPSKPAPTGAVSSAPPVAAPSTAAPTGGAAASAPNALEKATFAGAVDTGAAGLAIAQNNGKVLAYVCDGYKAEAWLAGTTTDTGFQLTGDGGSLTATYANNTVTGSVSAAGKTWHFTLRKAKVPSGLYRSAVGVRKKLDASWAVTPDGKQWGVQTVNGVTGPAPTFDTASDTVTVDGTSYQVVPGDPTTGI